MCVGGGEGGGGVRFLHSYRGISGKKEWQLIECV